MSGRKKNKNQRRQPPSELLSELNSIRDLLGSDAEADIPLLDQVAKSAPAPPKKQPTQRPQQQQIPQYSFTRNAPRPLQESDLPILFSPIEEEMPRDFADEFKPVLSETDRALLRPLQDLPRAPVVPTARPAENQQPQAKPQPAPPSEQVAPTSQKADQSQIDKPGKAEHQPGLFDAPLAREIPKLADNPFLPPHIRARLTGGRVPKSDGTQATPVAEHTVTSDVANSADHAGSANAAASATEKDAPQTERQRKDLQRQQLIDQLVAEQLPELEKQLRTNIALMLDELDPYD